MFAASFNRTKPQEKTTDSTESLLKAFHDWSQFVNAMTKTKRIMFREEILNALELTKFFERFRPIQTTENLAHIQARSTSALRKFFCELKYQNCYT